MEFPEVKSEKETQPLVVMLHGIAKGKLDMYAMGRYLQRDGYEVINYNYASTSDTLETLSDKLAEDLKPYENRKLHFVTHSMGGIVVRTYFNRHFPNNVGRFVMIAPPNQGAELADFLGNVGVYQWFFGPAGQQLRRGEMGACLSAGAPTCEFGVIAGGTGKRFGLNPILPGDNDGTVTVESTHLEGEKDFVLLPYPHPFIQMMPKTGAQVKHFLDHGTFHHKSAGEAKFEDEIPAVLLDTEGKAVGVDTKPGQHADKSFYVPEFGQQ